MAEINIVPEENEKENVLLHKPDEYLLTYEWVDDMYSDDRNLVFHIHTLSAEIDAYGHVSPPKLMKTSYRHNDEDYQCEYDAFMMIYSIREKEAEAKKKTIPAGRY